MGCYGKTFSPATGRGSKGPPNMTFLEVAMSLELNRIAVPLFSFTLWGSLRGPCKSRGLDDCTLSVVLPKEASLFRSAAQSRTACNPQIQALRIRIRRCPFLFPCSLDLPRCLRG